MNPPSEVIVPSLLPLWEPESLLSLCALTGDLEGPPPEMLRTLKSISRLDFLILGLVAEMVSLRSGTRPIGVAGTLGGELSVMEARRRRMGEVSAGGLTDAADVAFVTEGRRVALREGSTLSSSMLRRSGDGIFGESPRDRKSTRLNSSHSS